MMMRKRYIASRSSIDENIESVSRSWIIFRHGIVAKPNSAAKFSATEELTFMKILSQN